MRLIFSQTDPIYPSGVMRFLQTEWHRHERDRNAWEIERAEMKSRIGKLEGDGRTSKRLQETLGKHVKILENALKREREKIKTLQLDPPVVNKHDDPASAKETKETKETKENAASAKENHKTEHKRKCSQLPVDVDLHAVIKRPYLSPITRSWISKLRSTLLRN